MDALAPAATRKKELRLDLGCGENKREGFTGVDIAKVTGVDKVCNLFKFPWPWKSNSVSEIHCSHFIEHVPDFTAFMDECYRILKPGAQMTVIAPYYTSIRAFQDPTHLQTISENRFFYYNASWRKENKLEHYGIKSDFDFSWGYIFDPEVAARNQEYQAYAVKHLWNAVHDIQLVLTKRPPDGTS